MCEFTCNGLNFVSLSFPKLNCTNLYLMVNMYI